MGDPIGLDEQREARPIISSDQSLAGSQRLHRPSDIQFVLPLAFTEQNLTVRRIRGDDINVRLRANLRIIAPPPAARSAQDRQAPHGPSTNTYQYDTYRYDTCEYHFFAPAAYAIRLIQASPVIPTPAPHIS